MMIAGCSSDRGSVFQHRLASRPCSVRASARSQAAKFLDRFPRLAQAGQGWDHAYAGWFHHLLGLVEQALFPIVVSEYEEPSSRHIRLSSMRPDSWERIEIAEVPLPPPAEDSWQLRSTRER